MDSSSNDQPNEGGRFALAGFLYQFLGTAALGVGIEELQPHTDEVSALFRLATDNRILAERFGQDAVLEHEGTHVADGQARRVLIQYKYSSLPTAYPLEGSDLEDIATSLIKSAYEGNKTANKQTDFVIVTNRAVGGSA